MRQVSAVLLDWAGLPFSSSSLNTMFMFLVHSTWSVSKALWPGLKLWWTRAWAATQTNNNPRKCKTRKLALLNFRTGSLSVLTVWPSSCFVPLSKTQSKRGGTVRQNMSAKNFILCFYVFVISRGMTVVYSEQRDGNEGNEYYWKCYIHLINCQRT